MDKTGDILTTDMLNKKEKNYGEFINLAILSQSLKGAMKLSKNWNMIDSEKREALEMIQCKIARILNGDPYHKDSWVDIIGYAKLVERELS